MAARRSSGGSITWAERVWVTYANAMSVFSDKVNVIRSDKMTYLLEGIMRLGDSTRSGGVENRRADMGHTIGRTIKQNQSVNLGETHTRTGRTGEERFAAS